jgi:hypothetical protein
MNDIPTAETSSVNLVLGCGPQIKVEVLEKLDGTLFIKLEPVQFDGTEPDIDGFFLNLVDDSITDSIVFFPVLNDQNVTGQQADANTVDTLSNGAMVKSPFDLGLQFGTVPDSTEGDIKTINFTLRSELGPLTLADIDLDSMAAVVNSDGPNGLVLTVDDKPGGDDHGGGGPVEVTTTLLAEDFDGLKDPDDSAAIVSDDRWEVKKGQLVTDGKNDGTLTLARIATGDPVTLRFEIRADHLDRFENGGPDGDSLTLQVQIDDGRWITLDEFRVNGDNSAMVGSQTGQSFDETATTLSYSGGILDSIGESVQFRFHSDISAPNERIFVDNLEVAGTQTVAPDEGPATTIQSEDFDDLKDPDDSDEILSDDRWDVRDGQLYTDGCNDGTLTFAEVGTDKPVELCFDIRAAGLQNFETGGHYGDSLTLQVQIDGGAWQTLDVFTVNGDRSAMVGSETGNSFDESATILTYSGGVLDTAGENVQFRFLSDISASDERIFIDDFKVNEISTVEGGDDPCATGDAAKVDFEGLAAGDSVSDQFAGVGISAQRAGDGEGSQNDAMIFDTGNPTGGDHDLGYDGVGNALIISEDNDANDPDDNAHGGTLSFAFEAPSTIVSMNFLDIEEAGGTIDLYDEAGELIRTLDIPVSGDNQQGVLTIDTPGVSIMDVNLIGSGAVDDLCYLPPADDLCHAQYPVDHATGLPLIPIDEETADDSLSDDDAPPPGEIA